MRTGLIRAVLALFLVMRLPASASAQVDSMSISPAASGTTQPPASATTDGGDSQPKHVGGSVSAPVVLHMVDPQYSDEARSKQVSGNVLINLVVDRNGNPTRLRVVRGVGVGLDEKALAAVQQYKFKPAMQDGKPVAVELNIEVNFQIYTKPPTATRDPSQVSGGTGLAAAPPAAAYASDPHFLSAWKEAKQYEGMQQFSAAADSYKKANKAAGGLCEECLRKRYALEAKIGSFKDAAATAADLAELATTPSQKSKAKADEAQALYLAAGEKPKPAQLETVDGLLKAALDDDGRNATARYLDGKVLAQLGRLDASRVQFEEILKEISPKDPTYARVKRFAQNPELSCQKRAPAFTVTALDGSKFDLDDMGGRVVLIDFWATWCGPCNAELPHMKKIAKEFAGQPLVILSISWDSDAAKWKDFIAKNDMSWEQYRDADHSLTKRFGIDAIPHYFTIDSDGVLTSEMMGSGSDVEGKLRKLVAKAKAAHPADRATSTLAGAGN